jgi:signal transduction histidine kinase
VTDTGCGVSPENVEKIFERFEKLNNFETGFGLGLAICRAIADRMGGSVRLDTTYIDGARFIFVVPVK